MHRFDISTPIQYVYEFYMNDFLMKFNSQINMSIEEIGLLGGEFKSKYKAYCNNIKMSINQTNDLESNIN